ncbi:G2 M phase-specific E3 ubiquitin- ligase-like [Paramuricea clavata]|uniref:HECT-type E3 ubiquitin transferase n=1 Tax=Paramuricea clavata TaxID=317549 RepID=A0A7D9HQI8_PARCT|nr:G2 M phase-specific E3 ubiquitin- ligase-like [Paramuricea clavata]
MNQIFENFGNADEIVEDDGNPPSMDADASNVKAKLSAVLTDLRENMSNTENRLHIRRKKLWDDLLDARKSSKWFKPDGVLRIVFIGEPAVDGGGPKREFLTGQDDIGVPDSNSVSIEGVIITPSIYIKSLRQQPGHGAKHSALGKGNARLKSPSAIRHMKINCILRIRSSPNSETTAVQRKLSCDKSHKQIPEVTLKDFLKFVTGTNQIPPLGFPKNISVGFQHGCLPSCKCRPKASTCSLTLTLPIHADSSAAMQELLISALTECYGFGYVFSNTVKLVNYYNVAA